MPWSGPRRTFLGALAIESGGRVESAWVEVDHAVQPRPSVVESFDPLQILADDLHRGYIAALHRLLELRDRLAESVEAFSLHCKRCCEREDGEHPSCVSSLTGPCWERAHARCRCRRVVLRARGASCP